MSVIVAVLYTFLPYHFVRGQGHLLLSGYSLVPLGVLLALSMFDSSLPLVRLNDADRIRLDLKSRRSWWVVAALVGLASTGSYYFVFSMGLIVLAACLAAVSHRRRLAPLMSAGAMVVVGGIVFGLNVSPTLLYTAKNGANPGVATRSPTETELYGLRISQLVLPREGHRVAPLAKIAQRSQGKVVPSEPGQQLGLIGAVGFGGLLAAVAGSALGRLRGPTGRRLTQLGLLTTACLLVATISGGALITSALGLSYIRAWNRISVMIGCMALLGVALVIERYMSQQHARRWLAPAIASALVVVGFVDQLSPRDVYSYRLIEAQDTSYRSLFGASADIVGPGGSVFMWPHVAFPEVPDRGGTGAYDQAIGFVYEPDVNWSFGFARGRHPDYPFAFENQPARDWLTSVVAIGFRALVVDRAARSGVNSMSDVEPDVQAVVGQPVSVSADNRYALYDLRSFATSVNAESLKDRAATALAG